MVLANKSTVPDDDSILQEIDNYLEGGEAVGEKSGDSEKTTLEPPRHMFMAVNYASVSGDHGARSSAARGTSDFFPSNISKRAMEKAFVKSTTTIFIAFFVSPVSLRTTSTEAHCGLYMLPDVWPNHSIPSFHEEVLPPPQYLSHPTSSQFIDSLHRDVDFMVQTLLKGLDDGRVPLRPFIAQVPPVRGVALLGGLLQVQDQ